MRSKIPEVALSTDVITGFPGETEEDFQKTVELMKEIEFDFAYMFKYSERDKTYAQRKMKDDVPEEVKKDRLETIIEMQEEISLDKCQARIGETVEVMIEGTSKRDDDEWSGRTDDFKTTVFPDPEGVDVGPGDFVDVDIKDSTSHTLKGEYAG